jgi:hypothetical protein
MSLIYARQTSEGTIEMCVSEEHIFWTKEITDWTALKLIADLSNFLACRPRQPDVGSNKEK